MIVKVQISLFSSDGRKRVLIYNEERSFEYEGGANQDMIDVMKDRAKAYFEAGIGPAGLEIGCEVEEQPW